MDRVYKLLSFFLSVAFYLMVVGSLVWYFVDTEPIKKVELKAQSIDVYLATPAPKPQKVVPQKIIKPKPPKAKPAKKEGSSSPKHRASLNDLFASIDTKRLKRHKTPQKRAQKPSRFKGEGSKKAKKLLEQLRLKEYQPSAKRSIKSISGEKDPYLEKVYKILYTYWMPSKLSAGNRAKVQITIYPDGHMEYKVLRYSPSQVFNQELDNYLEIMRMQSFPKPQRKREFIVYFEAKE